jgi:hypothetical protein
MPTFRRFGPIFWIAGFFVNLKPFSNKDCMDVKECFLIAVSQFSVQSYETKLDSLERLGVSSR